jgi:hypothetical protein
LAGLGLFVYAQDIPPAVHYLLSLVMGILLLRRSPRRQRQRAESTSAREPSTVSNGER